MLKIGVRLHIVGRNEITFGLPGAIGGKRKEVQNAEPRGARDRNRTDSSYKDPGLRNPLRVGGP